MISCLAWIPKGAPKRIPEKLELSEEEFNRISSEIGAELTDAKMNIKEMDIDVKGLNIQDDEMDDEDSEELECVTAEGEDELAKYNLDDYDNEAGEIGIPVFGKTSGLSYHENGDEQDPYITLDDNVDDDEELREMEIEPTDSMIIACKTEDDVSHLEIYLYEQEEDNLYVHHDIMLPSFPLCAEWMDYKVGKKAGTPGSGNYVAIGTFDPEIEIWDLDVIDSVYPDLILGSGESSLGPKPTGKKKRKAHSLLKDPLRHVNAVTSISWNKTQKNILLSASADHTVKLWDLSSNTPHLAIKSYEHHTDKVTAVSWNQAQPTVFLTGGYDQQGRICALDSRVSDKVASWTLGSDVECIKWETFRPERFLVSTEDGLVRCFDARQLNGKKDAIYTIHAHDSAVSSLDTSSHVDGLLVTGGADKMVKVWDVREGETKGCLASRDLGVGKVFAANFCVDSPLVLAASGSKGKVIVWNLENNPSIRKIFGNQQTPVSDRKEIIEMLEEDDDEEDDGEQEELEEIER